MRMIHIKFIANQFDMKSIFLQVFLFFHDIWQMFKFFQLFVICLTNIDWTSPQMTVEQFKVKLFTNQLVPFFTIQILFIQKNTWVFNEAHKLTDWNDNTKFYTQNKIKEKKHEWEKNEKKIERETRENEW